MSLGGGLFIFIIILFLFLFLLPIRLHIQVEHHEQWSGSVVLQILWFRISFKHMRGKLAQRLAQRTEQAAQRMEEHHRTQERSIQLYWKPIFSFGRQALHIIAERVPVEQLQVQCRIGWSRADYTAYGYGLFWALLSALPERWLQMGTFAYEPDFQRNRQDVSAQGIICCRAAQIIGILVALFALTVRMMLAQNRKEQMRYET